MAYHRLFQQRKTARRHRNCPFHFSRQLNGSNTGFGNEQCVLKRRCGNTYTVQNFTLTRGRREKVTV